MVCVRLDLFGYILDVGDTLYRRGFEVKDVARRMRPRVDCSYERPEG
jgi:hypothetical protein